MTTLEIKNRFKTYPPAKHCIYCGDVQSKLTTEHIIPRGIGGLLQLPMSSCLSCSQITSARESKYQNETLAGLKAAVHLVRRAGQSRRGNVRVEIKSKGTWQAIKIPAQRSPVHIFFPLFQEPELIRGAPWDQAPLIISCVINEKASARIISEHGPFRPKTALHVHNFGIVLAKIAHSYALAVAPQIAARMTLPLSDLILKGSNEFPSELVGCPKGNAPYPSDDLHEIEAGIGQFGGKELLIVRIRLFSFWRAPNYVVVAGIRDLNLKPQEVV